MSEANRRLLPPAPLPRRGVWGEGNVDVSPGSATKKSTAEWRCFFVVDYGEKLSNYMCGLQVLQTFSESIKEENVSDSLI